MEAINKKDIYNIGFIICLTILLSAIPFSSFIDNDVISTILSVFFKVFAIIVTIIYIKKDNLPIPRFCKLNNSILIYLPCLLICFSNIIYCLIFATPNNNFNINTLIIPFINCILTCVLEELLFRNILLSYLLKYFSKNKSILISSLCFGLIHLLNINSFAAIPFSLIQCVYCFFLGLLLSSLYIDSNNLFCPIIFHFLFNFINGDLVTNLYIYNWDIYFFIINIAVALIIIVYCLLVYKHKRSD